LELVEEANSNERRFEWLEAAITYYRISESLLERKQYIKAAEYYKKAGNAFKNHANTVNNSEDYIESKMKAIEAYNKASGIFKQQSDRAQLLEVNAEINLIKGLIQTSVPKAKEFYQNSYELFLKSKEIYSKNSDFNGQARCLNGLGWTLYYKCFCCEDAVEIENLGFLLLASTKECWDISKKINEAWFMANSMLLEYHMSIFLQFIIPFTQEKTWIKIIEDQKKRFDQTAILLDDCEDSRVLATLFLTLGDWYCNYAFYFNRNDKEQRYFGDIGLNYFQKGLNLARIAKDKSILIVALVRINYHSLFLGRFKFVQTRVEEDINESEKLGQIFNNMHNFLKPLSIMLKPIYYSNIAQRSFLNPNQRKFYALKAISSGETCIKAFNNVSFPVIVPIYQFLAWAYSQLVYITETGSVRDKYSELMLFKAKKAAEISREYKGGLAKAGGFSSLYKSYKTLADISETKDIKIKMLESTIDAQKQYMEQEIESRTGILGAYIRLGILYEELGIIKNKEDLLKKAQDLFKYSATEAVDKGYDSYAATAHEYLARIDDRLGQYKNSAKNYEIAQQLYEKSLSNIEYILLKKKVRNKANYLHAWSLIENAKFYHKQEDHLISKDSYKKASEILKSTRGFKFEAPYYFAWTLLEEAEELSKRDEHDFAINQYQTAIDGFKGALNILNKSVNNVKDKFEVQRINKLMKVAEIRIEYCSAKINLEHARNLAKIGKKVEAADRFGTAASIFRNLCYRFKIKFEKEELEAIYYLCRAWEVMELAEKHKDPNRFGEASVLFRKASDLFHEGKLKLLALGNSDFCKALKMGCKFDELIETESKKQLYPVIKTKLRKAAESYNRGGFNKGSQWALATSTYFDATWHIMKADKEIDLVEKERLLKLGSKILESTANLFKNAGYREKEREILEKMSMIKQEEKIILSALNSIRKPEISNITTGIIAPSCPLETSQSPRLSETRQFSDEEKRVAIERIDRKKYQLVYRDLLKEHPKVHKSECRVGIAQIIVSETEDIMKELFEMKSSGLLSVRENKIEEIRSKVKILIEKAHNEGVNILLFPEMSIDLNYIELYEELSDIAKLYEMYIVPGSFHDQETKRNICKVFGPEGILWEQEKHIPAVISTGAGKHFKEGINVISMPRKTIICNTEYGRIAIAICRDFLDMDLRVELKNFEPPIDIILNPAFTPVTADFKAAHFDARRSIYAYSFFANIGEFGESLIYTPEKDRTDRIIPAKKEDLIYKDIYLFKLRSERQKWEKEKNKERLFIQSTR